MWLSKLFFTLRGRYSADKPIPYEGVVAFLRERGYAPIELEEWFFIADNAFMEWVGEKREAERKELERKTKKNA